MCYDTRMGKLVRSVPIDDIVKSPLHHNKFSHDYTLFRKFDFVGIFLNDVLVHSFTC